MGYKQLFLIIALIIFEKGLFAKANNPFDCGAVEHNSIISRISICFFQKKTFNRTNYKDENTREIGLDSIYFDIDGVSHWKATLATKLINRTENPRLIATTLAIMLGTFGVHRLYLGTHAKVPIVYTVTFGGGFGIITLVDIIAILATKDLSKFQNNSHIIMWIENK